MISIETPFLIKKEDIRKIYDNIKSIGVIIPNILPKVFSFFTKSEITNDNKKGIIPPPINDAIAPIIPSEKPPVIRV